MCDRERKYLDLSELGAFLLVHLGLLALPVAVVSQRIGRAGRVRGRTAVVIAVVVITSHDKHRAP